MTFISILMLIMSLFTPATMNQSDIIHEIDDTYIEGEVHYSNTGETKILNPKQGDFMPFSLATSIVYYKNYKFHLLVPEENKMKHFQAGIIELMYHGVVYCVEPQKAIIEGVGFEDIPMKDYFNNPQLQVELQWIVTIGTDLFRQTQDDLYYFATQKMVWNRLGYKDVTLSYYSKPVEELGNVINLSGYETSIIQRIQQLQQKPSLPEQVEIEVGKEVMIEDQQERLQDYDLVSTVDGLDANVDGNTLSLQAHQSLEGSLLFDLDQSYLRGGNILAYPNSQTVMSVGLPTETTYHLDINAIERGAIEVKKVSNVGASTDGAVFGLYQNNQLIQTEKVDQNGIASFKELIPGAYIVKEEAAPIHHELDVKTHEVIVTPGDTVILELVNLHQTGSFKITKIDDQHEALKGVEFGLYDQGHLVEKKVTDENGIVLFEQLLVGKTYQWRELVAPKGYLLDNQLYDVKIETPNQIKEVSRVNASMMTRILVNKVDSATKEPLEGVGFELRDCSLNTLIDIQYTNVLGQIVFDQVKMNHCYAVSESSPLEGYSQLDSIEVKVALDEVILELENTRTHTQLLINKIDIETRLPLKNVEFILYRNNEVFLEGHTNDTGELLFERLPIEGEYQLEEKPYQGYQAIERIKVELTNKELHQITIENRLKRIDLLIKKQDSKTHNPLQASFKLIDLETNESFELTTNEVGEAFLKEVLVFSHRYQLIETIAPVGYAGGVDEEFSVDEDLQIIEKIIYNQKVQVLPKTGAEDLDFYIAMSFIGIGFIFIRVKRTEV